MISPGTTGPGNAGTGQHFLLSAAARRLSLAQVARLTDDAAHVLFAAIRWADTRGEPVCPKCGCLATYRHKARRIYSCKACSTQFSATSGTMFHSRKLPIRDILMAIAIFANGAKGHAALQLGRDLDVSYKTAFVLEHKIREALAIEMADKTAGGVVEVDGAYFGGKIKRSNYKENKVDRRYAKNQNGKRRVVIVMRERHGRTLPFVVRFEADAGPTLERRIESGSVVHADEAGSWNGLEYAGFDMKRVNHEYAYSHDGACTNGAESFFSRLRRAERGIHHHIAGPYLDGYASEMAWREDARRIDNGTQFLMLGLAALTSGVSRLFRGYWQRHSRPGHVKARRRSRSR